MKLKVIEDGNSNFDLIELEDSGNTGILTPHCKLHGAMNKVSEEGIWRCLRAESNKDYEKLWTDELERDCRAGCVEYEDIRCPKCKGENLTKRKFSESERDYCYYCQDCEDQIAKGAMVRC